MLIEDAGATTRICVRNVRVHASVQDIDNAAPVIIPVIIPKLKSGRGQLYIGNVHYYADNRQAGRSG